MKRSGDGVTRIAIYTATQESDTDSKYLPEASNVWEAKGDAIGFRWNLLNTFRKTLYLH